MDKTRETLDKEYDEACDKYDFGEICGWCLPFPRECVIRTDAPKKVLENARKIDEILFKLNGKHGFRNFITAPEELKAFDDEVEWALKQTIR